MSKDPDKVILTVAPSMSRRVMGTFSLAAIGVLLLSLAYEAVGLWSLVFLAFAIAALLGAMQLWKATANSVVLTRTQLRTGAGRVLTDIANVKSVDRGAFAFKPSNGFLVKLHEPAGRGWCPGIWWQRGRLIGVGGVLPGGQTRAMAELLTAVQQGTFDELYGHD